MWYNTNMADIFTHEGRQYVRFGDKAIPFESFDENGKPIIKPVIENIEHPDGRKDVIVHVPFLTITNSVNK